MNCDDRVTLCRFDGETTQKNDYRIPPMEPFIKYRWPCERFERGVLPPPKPQVFTCPETLTKMRTDEYVPMNLWWRPKPIIGPLPSACDVDQIEDKHRAEVIRTRPRVYFGSAVSIDDVDDPEVRNLLLDYMYNTEMKRCMKEAYEYHRQEANRPIAEDCENVVVASVPCKVMEEGVRNEVPSIIPPIDEGLIEGFQFESWDRKQRRATVDPTVNFWTRFYKNRTPAQPLTSLIPAETIDRLTWLVENDKLRLPHDRCPCGYTGYMPQMTTIDAEKIELPMEHPMHTTNDTVYVNHFDHAHNNFEK